MLLKNKMKSPLIVPARGLNTSTGEALVLTNLNSSPTTAVLAEARAPSRG